MFMHKKHFMRPIKVEHPDPRVAQLILEQYGGEDSEAAAFGNYLTMRYNTNRKEIKDLLTDIGTEELGHWEMVAELVVQNGGGMKWTNAGGTPFNSATTTITQNIITCLWSNVAAELRARDLYLRLLNQAADRGTQDTLMFLAAREEAHGVSFLRAIEELQGFIGLPRDWYRHPYMNLSPGTYEEANLVDPPAPPPLTYPAPWPYQAAMPVPGQETQPK